MKFKFEDILGDATNQLVKISYHFGLLGGFIWDLSK